jgi:tetratricopeptide (TPR) repeat protein
MQRRAGDVEGAIRSDDEALRMQSGHLRPDSYEHALLLTNRGTNLLAARRGAEALRDLSAAERTFEARLGKDHWETITARFNGAVALAYLGRVDESRSALSLVRDRSPLLDEDWAWAWHVAGVVERLGGAPARGLEMQQRALGHVDVSPRALWHRLRILTEMGLDQVELGQHLAAERLLEEAVALARKVEEKVSPLRAEALVGLGRARLARGRAAEALAPLEEADRSWRERDPGSRWAGETALWLGECQAALGRGVEARAARARAAPILARSPIAGDARLLRLARRDLGSGR